MKYIDANRLKDEIKHLKIDVYDEAHQFDLGARSSLTFLESFIDSLQREHQEVKDKCQAEHLRKDALLKWLYGKMTIEEATEGFIGGYDAALKDVIDKINSV